MLLSIVPAHGMPTTPQSSSPRRLSLPSHVNNPHTHAHLYSPEQEMATTTVVRKADSPTLKRSFTPDLVSNPSLRAKKLEHNFTEHFSPPSSPLRPSYGPENSSQQPRCRGLGPHGRPVRRKPSMPVQTSSRSFVPMPSFMSVFGEEANTTGLRDYSERNNIGSHGDFLRRPASSGNITHSPSSSNGPFSIFHQHRDSTSTSASESTDSSPTTTISTMDSSSMTEPSPGPSPESPHAKVIPSSFVADFRSRRAEAGSMEPPQTTFFELQRPTTPAKKPRNLKNLAVNTSSLLNTGRAASTASLPVAKKESTLSAPSSPSFVKPPTPPRRKPSNLALTIQTPSTDSKPMRLIIPSTPSFNRPALRHFQSSPSLPLCSPSVAPSGGMRFPSLRPLKPNPHGFAEVPIEVEEEEDQEPNFDIPQSREEKPAAYPNGPICIYESGVYLYFEPTAEQAANYDVILNVASEVKNPFTVSSTDSDSLEDLETRRRDGKPVMNPSTNTIDFALPIPTKEKPLDTQNSSPTTPKATPVSEIPIRSMLTENTSSLETPEYIHIPWEHNTDIVPDLYRLVQIIDDRVQQGKRVLVHCQCGVSRSASLIVAYGLYKNPGISVQEAYDAVKKRSKWIGPNMNLIMQLQEFRNGLLRANGDRAFHNQVYGLALPRSSAALPSAASTGNARRSPFEMDPSPGSRTPRTAPLPPENDPALQRASTGNMIEISPGPLTAPSGIFFSPGFRRSWGSSQTNYELSAGPIANTTPYVDPKGHVVPVLAVTQNEQTAPQASEKEENTQTEQQASWKPLAVPNFSRQLPIKKHNDHHDDQHMSGTSPSITSPRSAEFHMAPLKQDDFDSSFGLLSPRATQFNLSLPTEQHVTENTPSIISPRSTEFHMTPLKQDDFDDAFGLLSPRATSFNFSPSDEQRPQETPNQSLPQSSFDLGSSTAAEFPRNSFTHSEPSISLEVTSPRSAEFHMTPLKPLVADDDLFGLTSPRKFEFPKNPFEGASFLEDRNNDAEIHGAFPHRRAHPIHPPQHLAQPQSFGGFASLNSSAHSQPSTPTLAPIPNFKLAKPPGRIDNLSSSPEPHTPKFNPVEQLSAVTPGSENSLQTHLTTPPRQNTLRTRFSSPNLQEQRRLHKLQTEMAALLPPRSPNLPPVADDIEALMSPRATEFTMNPFHIDLGKPIDDISPSSSNETIRDNQEHHDEKDSSDAWIALKSGDEDPRSPVQKGVSPIVRNIWDVL